MNVNNLRKNEEYIIALRLSTNHTVSLRTYVSTSLSTEFTFRTKEGTLAYNNMLSIELELCYSTRYPTIPYFSLHFQSDISLLPCYRYRYACRSFTT